MSNKINKKNKKKKGSASFESFSLKGKYRASELCLILMVSLYVFLLMVIYPFYMQNGFYDIGAAKWTFFSNMSFFTNYGDRSFYFPGVFMFIAVILIWYVIDHRMKKIPMKQFYGLTRMDDIVVAFLALVSISAILTPHKETVIDGYTYWNMGLITQIALVIIYLLVSRFWTGKKWEWYMWLAATWIVAAIGVLNRLGQDPLGTLAEKDNPQLIQFLSTIGQQTYFSNYVTVFIALGFFVYWKGREIDVKIISGIYILVVAMSLTASGNDSGFLAIFAALSILFWFSFRDNESMNAFFEIAIIVLLGFKLLGLMQITNENATALGGLSQRLTQGNETLAGLILFVILYAGLRYLEKNKDLDVSKYSVIRKIYLGLVIGAFVLYLIYGVLNTAKLLPASLSITGEGTQTTYFTFGDNWGNHRGAIWHIAVMTMGDWLSKDPLRFFFGAGPDCVIYELSAYHQEEILNNVGTELGIACVHNEWLNCLLGYGILGGASYIAIFVYAIKRALKNIEENLGVLMCVVAYMVHNFFCYQNIIVTPMIFVMIGCIEAGAHRAEAAAASTSDQK